MPKSKSKNRSLFRPEIDDITKFITTSENGVIRYAEEKSEPN